MIEAIKYRWQLRKLNRKCDELSRLYKERIEKAQSSKEKDDLQADAGSEILPIKEEIDSLQTKRFLRLANKLLVPIPEHSNKKMCCERDYGYRYILTDKGIWEIKKLIRREKRERREGFIVWLPALAGILASITGLAAVLTR
jgi:hypothetical protein